MVRNIQKAFARRFRALLCNNESGTVPWLKAVAEGEGPGYFSPSEAPWVIHSDLATMIGGVRALLLQALHPGSLAGVRDFSRYKADPLGRLAGTIQWLTVTTYASQGYMKKEAERVKGMHKKVKGAYMDSSSEKKSYKASDSNLLLWVHIAFTDSFLRAHEAYSDVPIPGGADQYVNLWQRSVTPLGLTNPPNSEGELTEALKDFEKELCVSPDTREVIKWIYRPPLPFPARLVYKLIFQAAYITLSEHHQEMIGIRVLPPWIIRPCTMTLLRTMKFFLGEEDPLQDAAKERIRRWEELDENQLNEGV